MTDINSKNILVKKNSEIMGYLLLIIVSFSVAFYLNFPALKSGYVVQSDVMQRMYWMGKFRDHELFENDIYFQYANYLIPWGYKFLYFLLAFLFRDPIFIGKIIGMLLYVFSSIYIFRLGKSMQGVYAGIAAFVLFVFFPMNFSRFAGGLDHSFAFPLLLLFIWYLYHSRIGKCAIILILQILFYPVIAVLSYAMFIVTLFFSFKKISCSYTLKKLLISIFTPLVLFSIFLCVKQITKPEFLGELVTKQEMYQDRSFWPGGREPYFPLEPLSRIIREKLFFYTSLWGFMIVSFIAFLTSLVKKNSEEIRKYQFIFIFFLVSIALYQLSIVFLFKLYIPKRYVVFRCRLYIFY